MTLVATAGSSTADSYLTLAAAEAIAAGDIGPEVDAWTKADEPMREAALRRATREIDGYVATGWAPYDPDQALTFPRETMDVDDAGTPFIPQRIKQACYQQAIYILKNKDALAAMNAHRASAGSVDPDAAYGVDPAAGPSVISPMAAHYLAGFKTAPRSRTGGNVGSLRVASGFPGTR